MLTFPPFSMTTWKCPNEDCGSIRFLLGSQTNAIFAGTQDRPRCLAQFCESEGMELESGKTVRARTALEKAHA